MGRGARAKFSANAILKDVMREKVAIDSEEKAKCLDMVNNVSLSNRLTS